MKLNKLFKQALAVVGLALLIISCEDEFGSIGTDIVGQVNFETEVAQDFEVAAYSRNYADASGFNGVQTNGSQIGVVGYYNDPTYGSTTSNFLSQVALSRTNPDFGDNTEDNPTVIDSVVFSLAYFATNEGTDDDGASTYTLDSIFGNTPGQMKLSVYRSKIKLLQKEKAEVLALVSKLENENQRLSIKTAKVEEDLHGARSITNALKSENKDLAFNNTQLSKKIEAASHLEIGKLNAKAVKRITKNRIVGTNKSYKSNKLHVAFTVSKNKFDIYLKI